MNPTHASQNQYLTRSHLFDTTFSSLGLTQDQTLAHSDYCDQVHYELIEAQLPNGPFAAQLNQLLNLLFLHVWLDCLISLLQFL